MFQHEYFVNEEKRTVICKLTCEGDEVIDDLAKHQMYPANKGAIIENLIGDIYIGKAKCMPGDTWDEEIGRRIAYKKAVAKFNQAKLNKVTAMENGYRAFLEKFTGITAVLKEKYTKSISNAFESCEKIGGNPADKQ